MNLCKNKPELKAPLSASTMKLPFTFVQILNVKNTHLSVYLLTAHVIDSIRFVRL
jgi:hypothetical protein